MTASLPLSLLAYGFLYLSVIALWFPIVRKQIIWPLPFFIALTFAVLAHRIMPIGMLPVALLPIAIYFSQQKQGQKIWLVNFHWQELLSILRPISHCRAQQYILLI